jgi:hypothetical protein
MPLDLHGNAAQRAITAPELTCNPIRSSQKQSIAGSFTST